MCVYPCLPFLLLIKPHTYLGKTQLNKSIESISNSWFMTFGQGVGSHIQCWMFVLIFLEDIIEIGVVIQFGAHSRYYKGALHNSKEIIFSDLYYCQTQFSCWLKKIKTNIQYLTLNFSLDSLSKCHDLHIITRYFLSLSI